ncbi:MAG: GTPase Era, partial [Myxococcota bacterium]|nr:GTPase Era [Myxococcota bacterium]
CWVVDLGPVSRKLDAGIEVFGGGLGAVAQLLEEHSARGLTVALNKVDILEKPRVLPVLEAFHGRYPEAPLVPISARTGDGVDALSAAWTKQLPEGPALFPTDQLMDCSESFVVSEIIREKIFRLTGQEIPYSTAVEVEAFEEIHRDGPNPRVRIHARIIVERSSQKGIIIGKRGSMLKQIGTLARKDIQALLGAGVHLELHVAVEEKWSRNPRLLRDLGIE